MTLVTQSNSFVETGPRAVPVVKTCGIMQTDHALASARFGASMIGLVFAPSRRIVSLELAASVRRTLDLLERKPLLVGAFVNEAPDMVLAVADQVGLDIVQLSGDESPSDVAGCAAYYPVLKALRFPPGMAAGDALSKLNEYRDLVPAERLRFVVDTYNPGEYGGTGKLANWGIATALARHEEIMLAGGLTPSNVGQAINEVAPWGVDVSSGIEREGAKDPAMIRSFIENAKRVLC